MHIDSKDGRLSEPTDVGELAQESLRIGHMHETEATACHI